MAAPIRPQGGTTYTLTLSLNGDLDELLHIARAAEQEFGVTFFAQSTNNGELSIQISSANRISVAAATSKLANFVGQHFFD